MKKCKCIITIVVVIIIAVLTSSCLALKSCYYDIQGNSIKTTPIKYADPEEAKEMLESFYHAAVYYSVKQGGNGQSKFPTSHKDIKAFLPSVYWNAFIITNTVSAIPVGGYIVEMLPDNTGNTFNFVAHPATSTNYKGDTFSIDQTEQIIKIKKEK